MIFPAANKLTKIALACVAVVIPGISSAIESSELVCIEYDFGGAKIASASQVNKPTDHRSLSANQGFGMSFGFSVTNDPQDFGIQLMAGVKGNYVDLCRTYAFEYFLDTSCSYELNFTTYPVVAMMIHRRSGVQLGAGIVFQSHPTLRADGPLAKYDIHFDYALGYAVEIASATRGTNNDKSFGQFGLRYTWLTYTIDGIDAARGNSLGVFFRGSR